MAPLKAISQLMLPRAALLWSRSGIVHTFMYSHLLWYYWNWVWLCARWHIDKHWLLCDNAHFSWYMSRLQNNWARKAFANVQSTLHQSSDVQSTKLDSTKSPLQWWKLHKVKVVHPLSFQFVHTYIHHYCRLIIFSSRCDFETLQ